MMTRSREFFRKVLEAPSPGRLLQGDFPGDAPGDGGWERFQRLSEKSPERKGRDLLYKERSSK